jgi:hypothetical protein
MEEYGLCQFQNTTSGHVITKQYTVNNVKESESNTLKNISRRLCGRTEENSENLDVVDIPPEILTAPPKTALRTISRIRSDPCS